MTLWLIIVPGITLLFVMFDGINQRYDAKRLKRHRDDEFQGYCQSNNPDYCDLPPNNSTTVTVILAKVLTKEQISSCVHCRAYWLGQQRITAEWSMPTSSWISYSFTNESDALMFKLRWGEVTDGESIY